MPRPTWGDCPAGRDRARSAPKFGCAGSGDLRRPAAGAGSARKAPATDGCLGQDAEPLPGPQRKLCRILVKVYYAVNEMPGLSGAVLFGGKEWAHTVQGRPELGVEGPVAMQQPIRSSKPDPAGMRGPVATCFPSLLMISTCCCLQGCPLVQRATNLFNTAGQALDKEPRTKKYAMQSYDTGLLYVQGHMKEHGQPRQLLTKHFEAQPDQSG